MKEFFRKQDRLVRLAFVILGFLTLECFCQECLKSTTVADFNKVTGNNRIIYHINAAQAKTPCLEMVIAHDGIKGGIVYTYKENGNEMEKRGTLIRQPNGKVTSRMDGNELAVHIAFRPNGVLVIHICKQGGAEEIKLVGFQDGKQLFLQADEEAKALVQYPNRYRVDHRGCKGPPMTPSPPTQTPRPPTQTPRPPTQTPRPPTQTPRPPTRTPRPPTRTPRPPTRTPQPPTETPQPPTETPKTGTTKKTGWRFDKIDFGK